MFTIKAYDKGSMDYTAFQCKTFRREWDNHKQCTQLLLDPVYSDVAECKGPIGTAGAVVCSHFGKIYIENAAGKTVDTISVDRIESCQVG